MVKVVILRFIRGQLDATSLRAALKKKGIDLSRKKATRKADKIVEALAAYLAKTDGPDTKSSFEGAVEALAQALAQCAEATAEELEELIDYFHEKLRAQRLTEAEHIALRLYTGPAYVKMNSSLRLASEKMPDWMTAHLKGPLHQQHLPLSKRNAQNLARWPHPAGAQGVSRPIWLQPPEGVCGCG